LLHIEAIINTNNKLITQQLGKKHSQVKAKASNNPIQFEVAEYSVVTIVHYKSAKNIDGVLISRCLVKQTLRQIYEQIVSGVSHWGGGGPLNCRP